MSMSWWSLTPITCRKSVDVVRIAREQSALLNDRHVDLVTPAGLHPRIRKRVLAEAVERYAA